jgi:hypothetical protein
VNDHGEAELDPVDLEALDADETRELARSSIYTWEFRRLPPDTVDEATETGSTDQPTRSTGGFDGDPPPEPGD